MAQKKFILKNNLINFFFISFLFSHIYLWDLQNIIDSTEKINFDSTFLRYLILIFLLNIFLQKKFAIKFILDLNILIFFLIFLSQFFINFFIHDQFLNLKEIGSIIFFFLLYFVVKSEKEKIIENLKLIFEIFISINFLSTIYFLFIGKFSLGVACNLFLVDSIIFHENSHYAMMTTSIFIFYLYIEKNIRNIVFLSLIIFSSLMNLSLTFLIAIIISLAFCLISNLFYKKKNNLWFLIFFIIFSVLLFNNNNCKNRINYLSQKTFYDQKLYYAEENKKENIKEKSYQNLEPYQNTSSKVYNIAILNTIYTIKNRAFGWGFNSYERLFNKNIINIVKNYYQIEYEKSLLENKQFPPMVLNTNDARSTLLKILNEFGIFSLFFLYAGLKFLLNKKVELYLKMTILSLLITQLISGAGYFNGGFSIFLFLMLLLNQRNFIKIDLKNN